MKGGVGEARSQTDTTKDVLEAGVGFSCWNLCFALTESGLISVNIPPSGMNQCISAMSVPAAEYWWWKFIGGLKMRGEKWKGLKFQRSHKILPNLSTCWHTKKQNKKVCTFKTQSVKYLEVNFPKLDLSCLKIHTYNNFFW